MRFPRLFGSHRSAPTRLAVQAFGHLQPGRRYCIVRDFVDYDGIDHRQGESWVFLTSSFLPYEDGLSLFVRMDDGGERHMRLQWRPEEQAAVIDGLERYVAELHTPPPR